MKNQFCLHLYLYSLILKSRIPMGMQVTANMIVPAVAAYFKHKAVASIVILACWENFKQIKLNRELFNYGFRSTFTCDIDSLENKHYAVQGILYFMQENYTLIKKTKLEHFSDRCIWLIIGSEISEELNGVRYDAEIVQLREQLRTDDTRNHSNDVQKNEIIYLEDILVHPKEGPSSHPWGYWSKDTGLVVTHHRERITRRRNFRGYPLRVASPVGLYSEEWYNGTYSEYIEDEKLTQLDSAIRCGYAASKLIVELLNATKVTNTTESWSSTTTNNSMSAALTQGRSDLSGAVLRILRSRLMNFDFIMPIWPFHVGFTYLAERESSSNMFIEPFTTNVWLCCLAIFIVLALAQRVTANGKEEIHGAYSSVLATFLQQDASAVPKGISGRWTFLVVSICAMLVHAYYTSAIVSALMSAGSGGPESIRALADSRYSIASEDFDYMRYLFFDVETNWEDLEYLKRKKKTSNFYFELERGAELVRTGTTAFHTEYNQLYPHIKSFTDMQICRLKHVDTVPEVMTWVTSPPNGQFTNVFRSAGAWVNEVGLGKRVTSRLLALRPACRAQMLAERVKFGDISQLLGLMVVGAVLSLMLLGIEILFAKWKKTKLGQQEEDLNSEYDD